MSRVIDADNSILGRLSSAVAKSLLQGEDIVIVNAEKAIVTGNARTTIMRYIQRSGIRTKSNPLKGPFFPRTPEGIVRRTVRGMLPWKKPRGKTAFKRLKVCRGIPRDFSETPLERVQDADASTLRCKFITVGDIALRV
ncbi:MAG: 50S ribosomal protein L13 [Candidatus Hodarchaeales archaeon]